MSKVLAPKGWRDYVSAGELPFELALTGTTTGLAAMSGYNAWTANSPRPGVASIYFVIAAVAAVALGWRAIARNRKALSNKERHALDGALHVLYEMLSASVPAGAPDPGLRICLFVRHARKADSVHQLTDYVGQSPRHGSGRNLPCSCGVVGLAFRTGSAQADKLPDGVTVTEYLVKTYGFQQAEASDMRQDRGSWSAVPVGGPDPKQVVAVIYADSSDKEFFGTADGSRMQMIEVATAGVANFVHGT